MTVARPRYERAVSFSEESLSPVLSARMKKWRELWSRDAAERISQVYTEGVALIPPDTTSQARGQGEILSFFEEFLPTVGDIRTSIVESDVSTTLAFAQGRVFFPVGDRQGDRLEDGAGGTYLTAFQRENGQWKIRFQVFKVEEPAAQPQQAEP